VKRDGVVEETGLGAGVLDDPITGIVWLARRMHHYGQQIEQGQIILSGSFIRAMECPPGSHIDADFGPFGRLTCSFA
jgi:2-oxo-hept-3-ene-1,7-dioate hydratase